MNQRIPRLPARWLIVAGVVIVGAVAAIWRLNPAGSPRYFTESATRGDVVRSLVASGTVNPVVTVQVGTAVSGVITSIACDYNSTVAAGQLCAQIDPRPYQVALDQARANLAGARAQLAKDQAGLALARIGYERDSTLLARGDLVSQETIDTDRSAYRQAAAVVEVDKATILQHQSALAGAQVNLAYTRIVSPVAGTVIARNIDVGQTVAASFQTPTLFLIAQDLTKMQVDTYVSESDIGGVRVGQAATFTVEGFPHTSFRGHVWQVRKAPITVQNVVTYDAVIRVDNPEGKLLPGMTANVRILTDERRNVLRVPLPALQFRPPGYAAAGETRMASEGAQIWVLRSGRAVQIPVKVGVNDGASVEIADGELRDGDAVIVGAASRDQGRRGSPPRAGPRI